MSVRPVIRYTPEEYLETEREADYRSEYFDGEIFAMSGATRKHNLIGGNVFADLHGQLRNRRCEVYMNDMRVKVRPTGLYTYPDVVVVCDLPRFDDKQNDTLLNPDVIIEVLSESTEAYDRGTKFGHYRTLDSFSEYLLVHQDRCHVEHYVRQPGNSWLFSEYKNPGDIVEIKAVQCILKLEDIYEKTDICAEYGSDQANQLRNQ